MTEPKPIEELLPDPGTDAEEIDTDGKEFRRCTRTGRCDDSSGRSGEGRPGQSD